MTHMPRRIGLIGFGSIGQSILRAWPDGDAVAHRLAAILVRPHQCEAARALVPTAVHVTDAIDDFLTAGLDLVVEAAGHGAVLAHGERILRGGTDLMLLSIGSLAQEPVLQRMRQAATDGGAQMLLPVGAIAGLDGLMALRQAGLSRVTYTSTKPPASWRDTPAESNVDLDRLTQPTVVFSGTAREAATLYPKNANLAAAVALAGLGFDETRVELVADPAATGNSGRIDAHGVTSRLSVMVAGSSAPGNPKTSQIVGMSVLSALFNQASPIRFV
ncbi:MAG: aspartate dehydrogenase [Pseudomonadota bacterium]